MPIQQGGTPEQQVASPYSDLELEAIHLVFKERQAWELASAFITDKVSFNMRDLIRQLRKNYWGVFDFPVDPTNGRKKVWVHLTKELVEDAIQRLDIDTKDINFISKKPESRKLTHIVKSIVRNYLDETGFGEDLDSLERDLCIDGTAVWKTFEGIDVKDGQKKLLRVPVDLLNCYIDPTARSIADAYRFTERSLLTEQQIKNMDGWINTDKVKGVTGLNKSDATLYGIPATTGYGTKLVDVWELWGKIPKWLFTNDQKAKDAMEEVDGHIVISGLERSMSAQVHLIETTDGKKPYEEAWYTRINGRWYGEGIAEKLLQYQAWYNTIANIRINRSYLTQLGIFKIQKGAGITPQMITRLATNGALLVNKMEDIEMMDVKEASEASYKDGEVIDQLSKRLTSLTSPILNIKGRQSATQQAIAQQEANAAFKMTKDNVGFFIKRWLKNIAMPYIFSNLKAGDIIRHTGDAEDILAFDERVVNEMLVKEINRLTTEGKFVTPEQVDQERQRLLAHFSDIKDRFVKIANQIDFTHFDVQISITNEEVDKGIASQNLINALQAAPEYKDQILSELFDIMGIGPLKKPAQSMLPQGQQNQQGQQLPQSQNPQQQFTQANTL